MDTLELATEHIALNKDIENRTLQFEQTGILSIDAIHLAIADTTQADYFVTCDDQFLKKAKQHTDLSCQVFSVLEFLQEVLP